MSIEVRSARLTGLACQPTRNQPKPRSDPVQIIALCERFAGQDAKVTTVPLGILRVTRAITRLFQWTTDAADRLAFSEVRTALGFPVHCAMSPGLDAGREVCCCLGEPQKWFVGNNLAVVEVWAFLIENDRLEERLNGLSSVPLVWAPDQRMISGHERARPCYLDGVHPSRWKTRSRAQRSQR